MSNKYAEEIKRLIIQTGKQIQDMEEDRLTSKPAPNKWSKIEILGHLIDSAYNNHQRFLRAWDTDDLIFAGYDQEAWVHKNNYQKRDVKEVIQMFIAVNNHIANLINQLDEELLNKTTTNHNFHKIGMRPIAKGSPTNLAYLIDDYIYHMKHHLKQILE